MYVAENSTDVELKSYSLAQIAWMVYESGNREVAINYLNESINVKTRLLNDEITIRKINKVIFKAKS